MKISETALPDVLLLTPTVFRDSRGAFWETWNDRWAEDPRLPKDWIQDNCSYSKKNVVRGIHYQVIQPQAKLVRAVQGEALDLAVDLRRGSPGFGKHVAVRLTAEEGQMLYIPVGFGHAFLALSETVGLAYKVTDFYCPAGERAIVWNDPDLKIDWPVAADAAILSDKDRMGSSFRQAEVFA